MPWPSHICNLVVRTWFRHKICGPAWDFNFPSHQKLCGQRTHFRAVEQMQYIRRLSAPLGQLVRVVPCPKIRPTSQYCGGCSWKPNPKPPNQPEKYSVVTTGDTERHGGLFPLSPSYRNVIRAQGSPSSQRSTAGQTFGDPRPKRTMYPVSRVFPCCAETKTNSGTFCFDS